jgi:geranylgeranyl diphosphate synthase type 3
MMLKMIVCCGVGCQVSPPYVRTNDLLENTLAHHTRNPVAHKIYGVPQTINAANYVYFLAYQELFRFRRRDSEVSSRGHAKGEAAETRKSLDEVITGQTREIHSNVRS